MDYSVGSLVRVRLYSGHIVDANIKAIKDNVRYFSHICVKEGLVGKTEGLRKAREEGRWSPPTREK
jgi:hypothetical protein